jgi:hypothetical protein
LKLARETLRQFQRVVKLAEGVLGLQFSLLID